MKQRKANFELLRIIAMLMIITLHYLDKGGVLPNVTDGSFSTAGTLAWGLEAFCVASVNVYVLLSAYFLAEAPYKVSRAIRVWAEAFFYAIVIFTCTVAFGLVPLSEVDVYRVMNSVFPVSEEHYWFVTAYLIMVLFAPLMNDSLQKCSKRTFRNALLVLFILLSVLPTLLPVKLPTDRAGYDAVWFLFLYLLGAYIRYHGLAISFGNVRKRNPSMTAGRYKAVLGILYVLMSVLIFTGMELVRSIFSLSGKLSDYITRQYHYNSVPCLVASVLLFLIFEQVTMKGEKTSKAICTLASCSFGVYLIHEHLELRYAWPKFFHVSDYADTPLFLLHWIMTIVAVYLVCAGIDLLRQRLFALVHIK